MSCERCEILPSQRAPAYVLLASPHPATRQRIRAFLTQSRFHVAEHELGIRMDVEAQRWREGMVLLADALTGPEQRETRVCLVPPGDDPHALPRAILAARSLEETLEYYGHEWLLDLLSRDALTIAFQAIIGHRPPRIAGYECLLRGIDRAGRPVLAGELYEAAEALDLLHYLDRSARLAAIRASEVLLNRSPDPELLFFIHFPPHAIYTPQPCLQSTLDAVAASRIRPGQIVFEAPDAERIADREHLATVLNALRKHGFKLALDNVRGYDSLMLIDDLRPEFIKLDPSLVHEAAHSQAEQRALCDVLHVAAQADVIPIACGVEHRRDLEFVSSMGIELTEGWYHSRPQPGALGAEQWRRVESQIPDDPRPKASGGVH